MALLALVVLVASQVASSGDPRRARSTQGRRTTPTKPGGRSKTTGTAPTTRPPPAASNQHGCRHLDASGARHEPGDRQGTTNTRRGRSRPNEETTTSDDAGDDHRGRPRNHLDDERLASGARKEPATTDEEEARDRARRRSSTAKLDEWTGELGAAWGPRRSGQRNDGRADDTLRPEAWRQVTVRIETSQRKGSTSVESEKRHEPRAINDVTEPNGAERRQPGRRGRAEGPRKR